MLWMHIFAPFGTFRHNCSCLLLGSVLLVCLHSVVDVVLVIVDNHNLFITVGTVECWCLVSKLGRMNYTSFSTPN
jgi:hypothetical protein